MAAPFAKRTRYSREVERRRPENSRAYWLVGRRLCRSVPPAFSPWAWLPQHDDASGVIAPWRSASLIGSALSFRLRTIGGTARGLHRFGISTTTFQHRGDNTAPRARLRSLREGEKPRWHGTRSRTSSLVAMKPANKAKEGHCGGRGPRGMRTSTTRTGLRASHA